jgi:hypothetical protein
MKLLNHGKKSVYMEKWVKLIVMLTFLLPGKQHISRLFLRHTQEICYSRKRV